MPGPRGKRLRGFVSLPLEEALRRLIKEDFLLLFSSGTDPQIVQIWVGALGEPVSPPSGGSLIDSLMVDAHSADARRRTKALRTLGESGDRRALGLVLRALEEDHDPD
jgi:hypothetical protein